MENLSALRKNGLRLVRLWRLPSRIATPCLLRHFNHKFSSPLRKNLLQKNAAETSWVLHRHTASLALRIRNVLANFPLARSRILRSFRNFLFLVSELIYSWFEKKFKSCGHVLFADKHLQVTLLRSVAMFSSFQIISEILHTPPHGKLFLPLIV